MKKSHKMLAAWILSQVVWVGIVVAVYRHARTMTPGSEQKATGAAHKPVSLLSGASSEGQGRGGGDQAHPLGENSSTGDSVFDVRVGILNNPDPIQRMGGLARILESLTLDNVGDVLAAFEKAPRGDDFDRDFRMFMLAWGRLDGAAALEYALHDKEGRKVGFGGTMAMRGWAERDPTAAGSYLETLKAGDTKSWLSHGLVSGLLARGSVDEAATAAMANNRSRARGESIDMLAKTHFKQGGSKAVLNWLDSIDEKGPNNMDSFKNYAVRTVVRDLVKNDPKAAEAWLASEAGKKYFDDDALEQAAYALSSGDRAVGAEWLSEIDAGKKTTEALSDYVSRWASRNPNEAGTWLGEQDLSEGMDPVVGAFAERVVRQDPESALAWAGVIQDEKHRRKAMANLFGDWMKRDRDAALSWIDSGQADPALVDWASRKLGKRERRL